ncbi:MULTISPECIES: ABC transporter permease [Streptomyces]|uniref:ABC transporter permease n=1 Tax=Streptomyces sudanensis TaxID=436397 RepID=A0ABY4T795_9ACTN|nr:MULTISPECIES: ABC transporter permease [Streptomyces]URN14751.1 ABC transporter permease [Streptomyces sudanensis]
MAEPARTTAGPAPETAGPARTTAGPAPGAAARTVWRSHGRTRRSTRTVRVATSAAVAGAALLAVLLVPPLVQLDQQAVDLSLRLRPPSAAHPFGTDDMGRDLLLRCVYGLRVSLLVGFVAALAATVVGTAVGALAGAFGGRTDRLVMRAVDAFASVPHLLLGIFVVAMFRPGVWPVIASVAVTHWLSTARIVRSEVLSLRSRPYVDAAVSGGASRLRVTVRHLLPAVLPQAGLAAVLMVPHAMWHESALSFLGLGLPAHQASLGNLVQTARGSLLAGAWWPTLFPGLLLIVPTLAIAGLAGAWRERLDPRRRSELML